MVVLGTIFSPFSQFSLSTAVMYLIIIMDIRDKKLDTIVFFSVLVVMVMIQFLLSPLPSTQPWFKGLLVGQKPSISDQHGCFGIY